MIILLQEVVVNNAVMLEIQDVNCILIIISNLMMIDIAKMFQYFIFKLIKIYLNFFKVQF